jgi:hypothetical protein
VRLKILSLSGGFPSYVAYTGRMAPRAGSMGRCVLVVFMILTTGLCVGGMYIFCTMHEAYRFMRGAQEPNLLYKYVNSQTTLRESPLKINLAKNFIPRSNRRANLKSIPLTIS